MGLGPETLLSPLGCRACYVSGPSTIEKKLCMSLLLKKEEKKNPQTDPLIN
jgi:hypothetical protein